MLVHYGPARRAEIESACARTAGPWVRTAVDGLTVTVRPAEASGRDRRPPDGCGGPRNGHRAERRARPATRPPRRRGRAAADVGGQRLGAGQHRRARRPSLGRSRSAAAAAGSSTAPGRRPGARTPRPRPRPPATSAKSAASRSSGSARAASPAATRCEATWPPSVAGWPGLEVVGESGVEHPAPAGEDPGVGRVVDERRGRTATPRPRPAG